MIRLKHQRHPLAFHLGIALDLANQKQRLLHLQKQPAAQIKMRHLATLEAKGKLDFVPFLQKVAGTVDFDFEIVVADADRIDVDLLEAAALVAGPGLIFLFLLLIAPFAVIHDSANRWAGGGGDFDQIETCFAGHP
jgi:hypothetical protein